MDKLYYSLYVFFTEFVPLGRLDLKFNIYSAIGVCMGFLVTVPVDIIVASYSCATISVFIRVLIPIACTWLASIYYSDLREASILKRKPSVFDSKKATIALVIVYLYISFVGVTFLNGLIVKRILANC